MVWYHCEKLYPFIVSLYCHMTRLCYNYGTSEEKNTFLLLNYILSNVVYHLGTQISGPIEEILVPEDF